MTLPDTINIRGMDCKVTPLPFASPVWGLANVEAPNGFTFVGGESALVVFSAQELEMIAAGEQLTPDTDIPAKCRWFLRCPNPATTTRAHPILVNVPCCDRCASWRL